MGKKKCRGFKKTSIKNSKAKFPKQVPKTRSHQKPGEGLVLCAETLPFLTRLQSKASPANLMVLMPEKQKLHERPFLWIFLGFSEIIHQETGIFLQKFLINSVLNP